MRYTFLIILMAAALYTSGQRRHESPEKTTNQKNVNVQEKNDRQQKRKLKIRSDTNSSSKSGGQMLQDTANSR